MQPDLHIGDADAECLCGLVHIQLFDITQKKDLLVNFRQQFDGLLYERPDLFSLHRVGRYLSPVTKKRGRNRTIFIRRLIKGFTS